MILTTDTESDVESAIKFYSENCNRVELVTCNHCGAAECLYVELNGGIPNIGGHPEQLQRITLRDRNKAEIEVMTPEGEIVTPEVMEHLLGTRLRVDGVMGFLCICGNDTRVATPEKGLVGQSARETSMQPHEVDNITRRMVEMDWKPDVQTKGDKTRIESFTIERIK